MELERTEKMRPRNLPPAQNRNRSPSLCVVLRAPFRNARVVHCARKNPAIRWLVILPRLIGRETFVPNDF
jgi:hypothetical protein